MRITLFFFSLLLIISCGPKTTKIMTAYDGRQIKGEKLVVVFKENMLDIQNRRDLNDDLGPGSPKAVFMPFFKENFSQYAKRFSSFNEIAFDTVFDKSNFTQQPLEMETSMPTHSNSIMNFPGVLDEEKRSTYHSLLPKESTHVKLKAPETKYVLFLDKIETFETFGTPTTTSWSAPSVNVSGSGANTSVSVSPPEATTTPGSSPTLTFRMTYVLWDNEVGAIIAYGNVLDYATYFIIMDKSTWKRALRETTKKMFKATPFYQRSRTRR
jgi:hypothetical protein